MTAFGLDLAGYSSGQTGFARADRKPGKNILITVYRKNLFCRKLRGRDPVSDIANEERQVIAACLKHASLVVDVPIDLQDLPKVSNPYFAWELTRRPVDFAFSALAPLADRIGALVTRFMHWMEPLSQKTDWLGEKLWETYPAASLELLRLKSTGYKGKSAVFKKDQWEQSHPGHQALANILNKLDWSCCEDGCTLTDDEFDAALCALTGVADAEARLQGRLLEDEIYRRISCKLKAPQRSHIRTNGPQGYVLLTLPPIETVHLRVRQPKTLEATLEEVTG